MGKDGKKSKKKEKKDRERGEREEVPQGILLDDSDAAERQQRQPQQTEKSKGAEQQQQQQQQGGAKGGKSKDKADKKEKKKRKEVSSMALVLSEDEASKQNKKQKVSKVLVTHGEGGEGGEGDGGENAMAVQSRRGKDENWDKRIEGQKFGEWSPDEVNILKERIKDWAAAHGFLDDYENQNFEFLFKRRQKQGGRGAKLADSERKAFLEISVDFPTRNPKQVYGYISRHFDADNYKGKWSEEEKESLSKLVEEKGEKWKDIGAAMGRPGYACRDKWRMMKNNPKTGEWSEDEVKRLKELVQEYFDAQQAGPGRGAGEGQEHLPLLDNISWKSISLKLGTRNENMECMQKWYRIAPSAISAGQWAKGEDKILLTAIQKSGVEAEHAIPWATLVPNRSLSQIKRRYKLIKNSIPNHNKLSFDALVEKLVEKYLKEPAPELPDPGVAGAVAGAVAELPTSGNGW